LPTPSRATTSSQRPALLTRLGQWIFTRRFHLPPPATDYRISRGLRVPMRDGVDLVADHYAPLTSAPVGTLLLRGPYGRDNPPAWITAGLYAARGFHVVIQSARGTFGSGGVFDPGRDEVADGADTVSWLRGQDWFTGRFATVGGSYLGFTQWALLADAPPELEAAVITMGPHDFGTAVWGTGSFALADFLNWSYLMAWQHSGGWIRQLVRSTTTRRRLRPVLQGLPLGTAARQLLGAGSAWYEDWLGQSDLTDPYWQPVRLDGVFDRVKAPVLLIGGWRDVFCDQTLEQFRLLRERGVDVALTVGPWTHGDGGGDAIRESLCWLWGARRDTPVRVFVPGGGGWRDLPDWPPEADEQTLYLRPDALARDQAPSHDEASHFVYDPADPTPTIGGRLLSAGAAGSRDDTRLAERSDVITFTGATLDGDLEVIGTPHVELAHSTDIPWADVFVRISEIDRKGRSRNVSDGYVRLGSVRPSPLRIELDAIAHRFRSGNRIRLVVAGGSFPRFARNLGTDEPTSTGTAMVPSTHVVAHVGSRLVLPVVS
jgi:uncharacterized protein